MYKDYKVIKHSSKGCDPGFRSYRLKDEGVFREGAINEYRECWVIHWLNCSIVNQIWHEVSFGWREFKFAQISTNFII